MRSETHMDTQNIWQVLFGSNLGYVIEMYEQYQDNPGSVSEEFRALFEQWGAPDFAMRRSNGVMDVHPATTTFEQVPVQKIAAAMKLLDNIRAYGHLAAHITPLKTFANPITRYIELSTFDLSEEDLAQIPAEMIWSRKPTGVHTGLDAVRHLKQIYTQSIAYEFSHIHEMDERKWLIQWVEAGATHRGLSQQERIALLHRLIQVDTFEKFLHRKFAGQKRFSIEGVDMLVPMLDEIISEAVHDGAKDVMIGMAHRGRLNVLAHVLGKPYEKIFAEFHHAPNKELVPSEGSMGINYGWTGDVKYHLGANREYADGTSSQARITLANNPSHLEFVDPVVEGFTRAAQENRSKTGTPKQNVNRALAILVHGDAAFPGEGVVAETLNLSRLRGYHTGGTLHVITNNGLGFTTESEDARSTRYASDLAKGFEIPIVHVNADDPEACLKAVYLAYAYRKQFHKDFLIDLVGYRRFGHNEMDDPAATQPLIYNEVNKHHAVHELYAEQLQSEGLIAAPEIEKVRQGFTERLQQSYDKLKESEGRGNDLQPHLPEAVKEGLPPIDTAVPQETLRKINHDLLKWPEGFHVYPKLERILKRREAMLEEEGKVDWAMAEILAFASILADGKPIRLTGQDTERGTFAHRHLVLHDYENGARYSPLHILPQARASFAIHNSPLSETAVMGFEYGYDLYAPKTLVLWEAQYGDFHNVAQVIIDQFLSAGRAKWGQNSSLVLLLPHGYEGQGPEHSSARQERFLQLSAENNWTIANLTTAAQYFHILRRQAAVGGTDKMRPLVIMTPKSLLRHPRIVSPVKDFSEGGFYPILEHPSPEGSKEQAWRLILCSGKMTVDLLEAHESGKEHVNQLSLSGKQIGPVQPNGSDKPFDKPNEDIDKQNYIVSIEQLYPFPETELRELIQSMQQLKEIVWVQEEPKNMGAWFYMEPKIRAIAPQGTFVRYAGRPERSSPAEGIPDVHQSEQARIIQEALGIKETDERLVKEVIRP